MEKYNPKTIEPKWPSFAKASYDAKALKDKSDGQAEKYE